MSNHLYDALLAHRTDDDRLLLELGDGAGWTYRDTISLAGRMASVLVAHGARPGDRVTVQVQKSPEALALYFACIRAGLALNPLNTAYTSAEVQYFVGDAEPAIVICDSQRAGELGAIAGRHGATALTLDADGSGSLTDRAAEADQLTPVDRSASDLAGILYTSGTTGRSKGAMLSHDNLLSNALSLVEGWQFSPDDVLLHALPIFHTHGLFVAVNITLAAGGSMIFLPGFDADEMVRFLPRATSMMGVPTFYTRLLAHPGFTGELVEHMRLFVSGSAPLLTETHVEFAERTGQSILERYGMTETNMITSNPYHGERRAGTVGLALPRVEIRVADPDTGDEVAPGDIGVVEVKGPNVFGGYWRMPEKTAEEFRPDGFFTTGDLGQIDDAGYLQIIGRGKDLIISGGLNVYPKEVEAEIDAIDGVMESAVIGVPHPDFGEGVVAVVVPQPGAPLDEATVIDALTHRLARFKQPKRVLFTGKLPRNTMGKVQKNTLRDEHMDILETS
ncbi:MAG: malonyl-CoA synthase [Actinomycetia bacterium]|nr:malonyl-CoA synthase [Actinomycetes bacterium]